MVTTAATCAFLPVASSSSDSGSKNKLRVETIGIRSKSSCYGRLHVKANAQVPSKINGSETCLSTAVEVVKSKEEIFSPSLRTLINQLPDRSMIFAAITAIFLAAEKQWAMLDQKPRRPDLLVDSLDLGRIVEDGFVFHQNFSIRSYEIGADRTASIETLLNHLQEAAINHFKTVGVHCDGFGSTPEMCKRSLIWVVTRMQVLVDRYPTWGDVVQVDTWITTSGKNSVQRDWRVLDCKTGETLARASSVWVTMNKHTRKLSKTPEEVRAEISPYFIDRPPVVDEDRRKLPKLDDNTAEHIQSGITPQWSDLDVNQHVNNIKYIGWILESAPRPVVENHELSSMTLEYRRECGRDSTLQSLTAVSASHVGSLHDSDHVECQHLLRLEDGAEVLRARTEWRSKRARNFE